MPVNLGDLKALKIFKVNDNKGLSQLPESFGELTNLENFDCSMTSLSELPEDLSKMRGLDILRLNDTKITKLSASIGGLKYLSYLYLMNNPGLELPE